MIDLLTLSIGIGLVVSLIFSETLGKTAGGLVVPGYVALYLTQPVNVALTFLVAMATFAIVRGLSSVLIVFGKRRIVLTLLIGFAITAICRALIGMAWIGSESTEWTVIGFIVPSLIALWMDRQGWLDTCTTTITAAVVVRLALVMFVPGQLHLAESLRQADQQQIEPHQPASPESTPDGLANTPAKPPLELKKQPDKQHFQE
jgi:poly-gamma-glutamate biosynthesis protein PgsC/CapC